MTLIRFASLLGISLAPLIALTFMALLDGGNAIQAITYEPVDLGSLEAVGGITTSLITSERQLDAGVSEDPAGLSSVNDVDTALSLPYEVAQRLAEVERALGTGDIGVVQRAKASLRRLTDDRLGAIEKLRPHGDRIAAAISARDEAVVRHEAWLSTREVVRGVLASAAKAISDGPEIEGEKKCLELLSALQKDLPEVADSAAVAREPADALTREEAELLGELRSRAVFREQFFTLRRATASNSQKADELKAQLDAWETFLTAYTKPGPPDDRDAGYIVEANKVRHQTELDWRWTLARDQASVSGLVAKVDDWLRVPRLVQIQNAPPKQMAGRLVRSWLEANVPAVPQEPDELKDIQEGFTDPADKRKLGFFEKTPDAEKQYYYWSDRAKIKTKVKGETQFNLKEPPGAPEYSVFLADYARCRQAFLLDGHRTAKGTQRFRDECGRINKQYSTYRNKYAGPGNPIDALAMPWKEVFDKAETIAAELLSVGADVWALLN